ncbi:MAG: phosphonoacetaldehyde reductase [Lachnospiraceae bacterium]|nr:phosphonoacetaldehyde reductase [Lachnospiraceae bacterium]
MREQKILAASENYQELDTYLKNSKHRCVLLVCGSSIRQLNLNKYFETLENRLGIRVVRFSDFKSNPTYASVEHGVDVFCENGCDFIIAVGGGSAMDVAKCIKLFSNMDRRKNYLVQHVTPNDIELMAIPTTAGSGSEATRFAVIYENGQKQSITDESCIPSIVLFEPSVLKTLPEYHKKATMLDALCHAIESFWSINSNEKSKQYSQRAIETILKYKDSYLRGEEIGNANMLKAANLAGRAINITQTTAGHAMCYKLTGLYGISHGHAAALCVSRLWSYMIKNVNKCIDARGEEYLKMVFGKLAEAFECETAEQAIAKYDAILDSMGLESPIATGEEYEILKISVNTDRLKNNPIRLDEETIDMLYHQILS